MAKIVLPPFGSGTSMGGVKIKLPPIQSFGAPKQQINPNVEPLALGNQETPTIPYRFNETPIAPPQTGGTTTQATVNKPGIFETIGSAIKSVFTNPKEVVLGAGKGVLSTTMQIGAGLAGIMGADKAAQYIRDNKDALNQAVETNLNPSELKDKSTALAVGDFIGQQVPYILAAEATAGVVNPLSADLVSKAGSLTLSQASKIGTLSKIASNVIGFTGLDQLSYTPDEGSRVQVLKKDILTLGVLEGLSAGLGAYAESKAIKNVRSYLDQIKTEKPSIPDLQTKISDLTNEVKTETGKTPTELINNSLKSEVKPEPLAPKAETQVPESPLFQEARKYKTAEEFVKAQEKNLLFRGTNDTKIGKDQAIFTSPSKDLAKGYGDKLQTFYRQQGNTLDLTKADSSVLEKLLSLESKQADIILKKYNVSQEIVDDFSRNGLTQKNFDFMKSLGDPGTTARDEVYEAMKIKAVIKNPTDINFGAAGNKEIISAAKKEGYDYIIRNSEDITKQLPGTEVISLNPKKSLLSKSQLTDIWEKAQKTPKVEAPKIEPAPIKVSRSQLPVGEGKLKTSGLEARMKTSLENAPEEVKNLSTYNQMNDTAQLAKAAKYVKDNGYEDAIKILQGDKPAPKGILNNSIYVAMTEEAQNNTELAAKLASLRSTRLGQEIQILSQVNKDNPVKYMTDLVQAKIEALGGEAKFRELRDAEIGKVKRAISINRLQKTDWNSFIDSITC